ncbi:MAG: hypothetical protein M3N26_06800 [Pseudomonadota bacterium]|nr:hypothetical protein [Pseudomonadota bacterium]
MPALRNTKHERFCQLIAAGKGVREAYEGAGYRYHGQNAARLRGRDDVIERTDELLSKIDEEVRQITVATVAKEQLTKQWVIDRLMHHAEQCLGLKPLPRAVRVKREDEDGPPEFVTVQVTEKDPAAANTALLLLGKELRMFIDRKEIGGAGEFADKSDEELQRIVAGQASAVGVRETQH